jgi:hypothetical protein
MAETQDRSLGSDFQISHRCEISVRRSNPFLLLPATNLGLITYVQMPVDCRWSSYQASANIFAFICFSAAIQRSKGDPN